MQPQEGRRPWLFACWGAEHYTELLILILDCTFRLLFSLKKNKEWRKGRENRKISQNQRDSSYSTTFLNVLATSSMQKLIRISFLLKFSYCSGEGPALLGKHLLLQRRDCRDFWEEHRPWAEAKQEGDNHHSQHRLREEQNRINMNVLRETEKMCPTDVSH